MSPGVSSIVILCEDKQHRSFASRFLRATVTDAVYHRVTFLPCPAGKQDAKAWIEARLPKEFISHQTQDPSYVLIVIRDADNLSVAQARQRLLDACNNNEKQLRIGPTDPVVMIIPKWEIETWLAYLDGAEVDETRDDYPKLKHHESDCLRQVRTLLSMCEAEELRKPFPPSLEAACSEYARIAKLL